MEERTQGGVFGVSAAQRRLMPGVPCWPCSPVRAFISHGREGDKTQALGLQWLGGPGQALLQGACRGWQSPCTFTFTELPFPGFRVVQAWALGWEQLSAAPA